MDAFLRLSDQNWLLLTAVHADSPYEILTSCSRILYPGLMCDSCRPYTLIPGFDMGVRFRNEELRPGACGTPPRSPERSSDLEVNVLFTTERGTRWALRTAGNLARQLSARIRLVVIQVVPYALPLDHPQVSTNFVQDRCRSMAAECTDVTEIRISVYLCRHRWKALQRVLSANSLVVVGGRRRWWATADQRLAKALEYQGHHVIFAELRSGRRSMRTIPGEKAEEGDQSIGTHAKLAWDESVGTGMSDRSRGEVPGDARH